MEFTSASMVSGCSRQTSTSLVQLQAPPHASIFLPCTYLAISRIWVRGWTNRRWEQQTWHAIMQVGCGSKALIGGRPVQYNRRRGPPAYRNVHQVYQHCTRTTSGEWTNLVRHNLTIIKNMGWFYIQLTATVQYSHRGIGAFYLENEMNSACRIYTGVYWWLVQKRKQLIDIVMDWYILQYRFSHDTNVSQVSDFVRSSLVDVPGRPSHHQQLPLNIIDCGYFFRLKNNRVDSIWHLCVTFASCFMHFVPVMFIWWLI